MAYRSGMETMERIKGKKIIVTGGTGFIGGHVVQDLLTLGANVTVVDIELQKNSYFAQQKLEKSVNLCFIDIVQKKKIKELFLEVKPSYVYHLAAEAIVSKSFDNPHKTFQTNIMGTVSVLEAARVIQTEGIIVASSDKAYGKTKTKYTETSPLHGDHPYDVSKSATDLIAQTYYRTYGLPIAITRFGNVYGEGDLHLDRIIPGICQAIIAKQPLQVRSNGNYVRDYLYVKDVSAGYIFLLKNIAKIKGEAFNFSSNDTLSVLELILLAEKILKTKIDYQILNSAKNEIPYQHLDDKKVKELGWKNNYKIKKVLPDIVEWYRKVL